MIWEHSPEIGIGSLPINDEGLQKKLKNSWKIDELPDEVNYNLLESIKKGKIKNVFIFGEDPLGCAIDDKEFAGLFSKVGNFWL